MDKSDYTKRELEFHFQRFDEKLDDIKDALLAQNKNSEARFLKMEEDITAVKADVDHLKTFQTKAMLIWLLAVAALTFLANRFL